jgi:hypothetical protein
MIDLQNHDIYQSEFKKHDISQLHTKIVIIFDFMFVFLPFKSKLI